MLDFLFNNAVKAIALKLIFCTLLRFVDRSPEFESHPLTFLLSSASNAGAGLFGRIGQFETPRYSFAAHSLKQYKDVHLFRSDFIGKTPRNLRLAQQSRDQSISLSCLYI